MKLKKLLTIGLACALLTGGVLGVNAAELDTAWYAAKNPDVVAVFGNSPEMLLAHYQMFGRMEGRLANEKDMEGQLRRLFQAEEYAALYPDIKAAFGDNKEAMFQHYLAFGLLESRRPSEKVSGAAAASLKKAVEKAMADAGITVAPGSLQLVEIITGAVPADAGGAAVQAALEKAAPAVEQAISGTVKEVNNPSSSSSGGGSSSSGSSSSSSCSGSSGGTTTPSPTPSLTLSGDVSLYGKTSDEGEIVQLTQGNVGDYFEIKEVDGELKASVKDGVTLYDGPAKEEITNDTVGTYAKIVPAAPKLKSGAKAYYLEEDSDAVDAFEIKDGNVAVKSEAKIYTEEGTKVTDASEYAEKVTASMAINSGNPLYYKNEEDTATALTDDDLETYFKVGDDGAVSLQDGKQVYSDQEGNSEVTTGFDTYITVTYSVSLKDNVTLYKPVEIIADTLSTYVKLNNSGDGVELITTAGKVYSESSGTLTEITDASSFAEVKEAELELTETPAYNESGAQIAAGDIETYFAISADGKSVEVKSENKSFTNNDDPANKTDEVKADTDNYVVVTLAVG